MPRSHYENTPIHIYWKSHRQKLKVFKKKKKKKKKKKENDVFQIFAQKYIVRTRYCGNSNEYPQFVFEQKQQT